ncbi:hypothetical protein DFH08DRAFT_811519 [Mycena albidolilacea]|uniref:Uncharacterized protein n=1 Tax=Mycena albidolilacea TaxID=1033008 RepID=A0AAD6ZW09_9AGAR|nr:hypothetical protein DFH08DRAFT_811519 [Mycena albidolilacea]
MQYSGLRRANRRMGSNIGILVIFVVGLRSKKKRGSGNSRPISQRCPDFLALPLPGAARPLVLRGALQLFQLPFNYPLLPWGPKRQGLLWASEEQKYVEKILGGANILEGSNAKLQCEIARVRVLQGCDCPSHLPTLLDSMHGSMSAWLRPSWNVECIIGVVLNFVTLLLRLGMRKFGSLMGNRETRHFRAPAWEQRKQNPILCYHLPFTPCCRRFAVACPPVMDYIAFSDNTWFSGSDEWMLYHSSSPDASTSFDNGNVPDETIPASNLTTSRNKRCPGPGHESVRTLSQHGGCCAGRVVMKQSRKRQSDEVGLINVIRTTWPRKAPRRAN